MVGSRRAAAGAAALLTAVALLATGCSSDSSTPENVREPAVPATTAPTASPAGTVTVLGAPARGMAVDPSTHVLAVQVEGPDRLLLRSSENPAGVARTVALPARAAQVSLSKPGGPFLVSVPGALLRVDQRSGDVTTVTLPGTPQAALQIDDQTTVVGTAEGEVLVLGADDTVTKTIAGLADVAALSYADGTLVALDRKQTSVTQVNLDDGDLGTSLRAGQGAVNGTTDRYGRMLVVDVELGQLMVFTADPLLMRQRFPVANQPYAVAYDPTTDLAWVTVTGRNQVVGYAMGGGEPVERYRLDTVAQPETVAVDSASGAVLVASASGGGLQRVVPGGGTR
ncbi:hypothetical protein [Rhodococcus sp. X156]|uniref:YncE family protein n=1 Tax=Rhodococcus sp. X156 TaxID=2499145 RepID=UPI000FDB6CE6|nr:hypothetical protein [Rhodococcus sp. X156]